MAFLIPCPHCGPRPVTEFKFGGEIGATPPPAEDVLTWRRGLYFNPNPAGPEVEWWFHTLGCGQWLKIERDTLTNQVLRAEVE